MIEFSIIIILVFTSVCLFVYGYLVVDPSLHLEEKAGLLEERDWPEQTKLVKTFYPVIKFLKPVISNIYVPKKIRNLYRGWLISGGFEGHIWVTDIIGLQIIMAVLFGIMSNVWFEQGVKLIVIFSILGFFMPVMWIHGAAKERREQIMRSLPGIVDMIALSVAAGLDFNTAVKRIIDQQLASKEPIIYELKFYMQNVRLGMSRSDALYEMAARVDTPDMFSFCAILIQADNIGASISETLQQQAVKLREERFLKAEKAGAAASQKMMLPMMLFIFPLIFAIILVPIVIKYLFS